MADQEIDLIDTYSITGADATFTAAVTAGGPWSLQIDWRQLTGTLDGVLTVQVSNYADTLFETYDSDFTQTLSSASGHVEFEDDRFAWKYVRVSYTNNNITGGVIRGLMNVRSYTD
nr:hypothetical protein 8 [bacterium]